MKNEMTTFKESGLSMIVSSSQIEAQHFREVPDLPDICLYIFYT